MDKDKKISVIIPCYNGFKYSQSCLNSWSNQTYKNFELVIVDDCSTDNSFDNFKNIKKDYLFDITLIRNSINKGPGYSRKQGVLYANGDYVCFCDIDDNVDQDYLKDMVECIEEKSADTVFCGYNYQFSDGKIKPIEWYKGLDDSFTKNDLIAYSQSSLCILLTKKEILLELDFPNIYHSEDMALIPIIIDKSSGVAICKKNLYNYYMRKDSASNCYNVNTVYDSIKAFDYIRMNLSSDLEPVCEFIGMKEILYTACLKGIKCKLSRTKLMEIIRYYENMYPNYIENIYFDILPIYKRFFIYCIKYRLFIFIILFSKLHTKFLSR